MKIVTKSGTLLSKVRKGLKTVLHQKMRFTGVHYGVVRRSISAITDRSLSNCSSVKF